MMFVRSILWKGYLPEELAAVAETSASSSGSRQRSGFSPKVEADAVGIGGNGRLKYGSLLWC